VATSKICLLKLNENKAKIKKNKTSKIGFLNSGIFKEIIKYA
jgi:hypothetical protein